MMRWICLSALLVSVFFAATPGHCLPAARYRDDLTRIAHAEWGLDAPVAVFAAQIHQESGFNPLAVSRVGALGMAQFMPATATWWCGRIGLTAVDCQPANPVWAMRALVGYDRFLLQRVAGDTEFDRLWATLRSYNGGLKHWQQEARLAESLQRVDVDSVCGAAKRSPLFCPENLAYPRQILLKWQPLYRTWGGEVLP